MKKMKNIFWGMLLVIPLMSLLSGCQKFLDRKPLTATLEDLNQGGLEGQIYGLYGAIRNGDIAGQGFGGIPWLAMHSFRSDDAIKGSSDADGADWADIYDNFNYVKDHWSTNTYYDHHYVLINLANIAIHTADSLQLNDAPSMVNVAEARFFRAFAYFDLVRTYGQVRKIDFPVYNAAQVNSLPKSPETAIYELIDADLQVAQAQLPLTWGSRFPGRLTTGAAKTLHAKTLLYRQQWMAAFNLAEEVINSGQYSLETNYSRIFQDAGENGPESIFEIQADIGPAGSNNYSIWHATSQGVRGTDAEGWNLGWGWNAPAATLVNAYEGNDPRKDATILFSGKSDDPAHGGYGRTLPSTLPRPYWNKKVYADPAKQVSTGDLHGAGWMNQRVLRLADVYLMAAEAANELSTSPTDEYAQKAEDYVEIIRSRARAGSATALPKVEYISQAQMRTAIQNERRYELAMEGERFFDLVRWGLAPAVLGPSGYQPRNKYYPLPQPVIDQSGGALVQNPDYP
jgi:starch-binding outer membrane protein, SusD/RagB family